MAHVFSLKAVLAYRQQRETEAERVLSELQSKREQHNTMLRSIMNELRAWDKSQSHTSGSTQVAGSYAMAYARYRLLSETRKQLLDELKRLEERCSQQLVVYHAARRDRELLSNMEEKQAIAWRLQLEKREQRTLDDVFAMRSGATNRHS